MIRPKVLSAVACLFLLVSLVAPATTALAQPASAVAGQQAVRQESAKAEAPAAEKGLKTYTLTPEKYQKAVAYSRARYRLHFISFVYGIVVLLLVLSWRLAPKFRDWAEGLSSRRLVQVIVYAPLLIVTLDVLGLPIDIYRHWLQVKYDLSVQGWRSWAWDWTKGELIGFVIWTVLAWILYGVIRRSPRRWWFYFWLATLPIIVFLLFILPLVIQPLFFKFEPLQAKRPALVEEIEKVVHRAGMVIPPERMFEMKASAKLKALNAYVAGIGPSKRVVVWDTTIAKMTIPQTLFVFGHEMGHYVLAHISKLIAFAAGLLFVILYLGYRTLYGALARWGSRWAIRGVDDWASLPVLLLLVSLFGFVAEPIENTFSRHIEHQADIYGLEVTHGILPDSSKIAAEAFQILGEIDLGDPNPSPFIRVWLYSHPPVADRIVFAQTYDPWSNGQSPKYVK